MLRPAVSYRNEVSGYHGDVAREGRDAVACHERLVDVCGAPRDEEPSHGVEEAPSQEIAGAVEKMETVGPGERFRALERGRRSRRAGAVVERDYQRIVVERISLRTTRRAKSNNERNDESDDEPQTHQ